MPFVVDASVTLPWCFEDEASPWTEALMDRVSQGELIHVPAHWIVEVTNALLSALRRKRIPPSRAEQFLDQLARLNITTHPPLTPSHASQVFSLCTQHNLTIYDGAYLELAQRLNLPLATLDDALLRAATKVRVQPPQ